MSRKLASIQKIWKVEPTEPVYCELIRAPLSMKVVSNKYLLKN